MSCEEPTIFSERVFWCLKEADLSFDEVLDQVAGMGPHQFDENHVRGARTSQALSGGHGKHLRMQSGLAQRGQRRPCSQKKPASRLSRELWQFLRVADQPGSSRPQTALGPS